MTTVDYAMVPIALKTGRHNAGPFLRALIEKGDAIVKKNEFVPLPSVARAFAATLP